MQQNTRFLLLYGSVTGKAESIAELIGEEATKRGLKPDLHCMADIIQGKYDLSKEATVVIVSSTTGDGDQPENAEPFWRKIKKKSLPNTHFSHLKFSILGLGDSNYSQFCNGPKTLHSRLLNLGATTFYEPAWADDGVGLEITVEPWIENLWIALSQQLGVQLLEPKDGAKMVLNIPKTEKDLEKESSSAQKEKKSEETSLKFDVEKLIAKFNDLKVETSLKNSIRIPDGDFKVPAPPVSYLKVRFSDDSQDSTEEIKFEKFPLADSEIVGVPIEAARRISQGEKVKRTYLMTLDLTDSKIAPEPGDAISLICPNSEAEVEALISRLGLEGQNEKIVHIELDPNSAKKNAKIPEFLRQSRQLSLKTLFTWHLEIRSIPKKPFLRTLAEFSTDKEEQKILMFLCSKEGAKDYMNFVRSSSLCLLDLLLTFSTCNPSLSSLLENLPRIQPRPYSVASSSQTHADLVFSVTEFPRESPRMFPRKGVATGWLENVIAKGDFPKKVSVFARSNKSFRHPGDLTKNLIMIGPGTGIAPFRGFLQKRAEMMADKKSSGGKSWLFFGCRHKQSDFLFRTEMESFIEDGVLTKFTTCFSRDEDNQGIKYVQDQIKINKKEFVDIVADENTLIYVCGDASGMGKDVNAALTQCISEVGGVDLGEAKNRVADLIMQRRYLEDIWT